MKNLTSMDNILIIKPGAIGDLLQLTPVLRALKTRHPRSRISLLVGSSATAALFQYNPHVSETLVFDKQRRRSFTTLLKLWRHVHRAKYDLVINFQRSNLKAWFLASAALPSRVLVYRKSRDSAIHVVENYMKTVEDLGISSQDRRLELFVGKNDELFAEELFTRNNWPGKPVIALNPGASHPVNRWAADRFAALADIVANRLSAKVIIIGGKEDLSLAEAIAGKTKIKPLVLTGKATLLQLGAVLKRCELLVSGDTGPLHLATAVGTRVVALFGAADPARTGPVGTGHRVMQARAVTCVPCRSRSCGNRANLECMDAISAQEVFQAIAEMLASGPGGTV